MEKSLSYEDQIKYGFHPTKIYYPVSIPIDIIIKAGRKEEIIRFNIPPKVSPFFGKYYYQFLPEDHPEKINREEEIFKMNLGKIQIKDMDDFIGIFNEEHYIVNVHELNREYKKYNQIFKNILENIGINTYNIELSHFILPGMYPIFNKDTNKMNMAFRHSLNGVHRYAFGLVSKRLGDDLESSMKYGIHMYHWITWAVNVIGYPFKLEDYLSNRIWRISKPERLVVNNFILDPFVIDKIRSEYEKRGRIQCFYLLTKPEVHYCIENQILFHFDMKDHYEWRRMSTIIDIFKFIYGFLWDETEYPKEDIPNIQTFVTQHNMIEEILKNNHTISLQLLLEKTDKSWVEKNIYFYLQKKNFGNSVGLVRSFHEGELELDKKSKNYIYFNNRYVDLRFFHFMIEKIGPYGNEENPYKTDFGSDYNKKMVIKNDILSYYLLEILSLFVRELLYAEKNKYRPLSGMGEVELKTYIYILDKYTSEDIFTKEIEYQKIPMGSHIPELDDYELKKIHFSSFTVFEKYEIDLKKKKETLRFIYDFLLGIIMKNEFLASKSFEIYKYEKSSYIENIYKD